ncbi:metallophosphoesterase [Paenibacillus sp. HWE-109]|uniref:metallophosphoesterase family protein n=1 Tax=Paenibacillus sp. HWE-109 TaxID=1306526 RepID=UPI001EDE7629|nr:metallophosphoesterase [Paenibacillus sp. HWE-109]UKS27062.1 metallophosphoesterase [Paenibacillus sp. HWE-109]
MRLIVMGDLHYSLMNGGAEEVLEARDKFYRAMIHHFVQLEADYHISLGDLTHEGVPEEFEHMLQWIGGNVGHFIPVIGNHDAYLLPKSDITAIIGHKRYQAIERDEAHILILDTTKEMNRDDWGGELDEEQLRWLEDELVKSGNKPVLVFGHHPVYGTTARSTMEMMSIDPRTDIRAVLNKKQGQGFYFCGHNHVNSIVQEDNWFYIQTAACLDVPAFRRVELHEGAVRIDLVAIDDAELANYMEIVYANIPGWESIVTANGEEKDRVLEVKLLSN